ncbi:MAG: GAF domain-containing sensor histidine kinase [Candidatus Dormibacteraeota bacterium]|nr:GAF domain-containing sensor histidine kinase [Candidatus Dormibacteraeota bacterium]
MITVVEKRGFPFARRHAGRGAGQELRRAFVDQLHELAVVTAASLNATDVTAVAKSVVDVCRWLMDADMAALLRLRRGAGLDDPGSLALVAHSGPTDMLPVEDDPPRPLAFLAEALRAGTILCVPDARRHAESLGLPSRDLRMGPVLAVPILRDTNVAGLLVFANRTGGATFGDLEEALAGQAAILALALVESTQLRTELEAVNRNRRESMLEIAHDLRGPAGTIVGYAELAADPRLPEQARRGVLARLSEVAARLERLALDFSTAANLERPEFAVSVSPLDPAELARAVVDDFRVRFPGRTLGVTVEGVGPVLADGDRLRQVLGNLLENGLKYTSGPVSLAVSGDATWVRFQVCDSGPGIDPEVLGRLFDPFYRPPGQGRTVGGTGLGLTIVKGLTEAMGGSVEASSGEQGSCFTLLLPAHGTVDPQQPTR